VLEDSSFRWEGQKRVVAQRVPYIGDEKESLQVSLDRHRDAVLWKLQGLGDAELRHAMLPSGNSLLGLSLRWVVIHILEDTARHAGHIDVMRELIDGMVGDHQWDAGAD
jgi:Protein of unknown function (DUF664)